MKVMYVGGGTLGPVTPLLACHAVIRRLQPTTEAVWVGTPDGPERALVEAAGIEFHALPVIKWPRYPSRYWITFPFAWAHVRRLADHLVRGSAPSVIATVGGFTSVPIVFAAAKRGIACVTHQLDVEPGMANRRIASRCASVTTSFVYDDPPFGAMIHTERIATPARFAFADLPARSSACRAFGLDHARPVVLVFGGGTGAQALNAWMARTAPEWLEWTQIIHVTGLGKEPAVSFSPASGYVRKAFLEDGMLDAYAAADAVICRAGLGTLSELAALKKAAILVPIPDSHQEVNAERFAEARAAEVIAQTLPDFDRVIRDRTRRLLDDQDLRFHLGERAHRLLPTDDGTAFASRIMRAASQERL